MTQPSNPSRPAMTEAEREATWTVWDAEARMAREGDWRGVAYSIAHDILPLIPEGSPGTAYKHRARMQILAADRLEAALRAAVPTIAEQVATRLRANQGTPA